MVFVFWKIKKWSSARPRAQILLFTDNYHRTLKIWTLEQEDAPDQRSDRAAAPRVHRARFVSETNPNESLRRGDEAARRV